MKNIHSILHSDPSTVVAEIHKLAFNNLKNCQRIREVFHRSKSIQYAAIKDLSDLKFLEFTFLCLAYGALTPETALGFKGELDKNLVTIAGELGLDMSAIFPLSSIEKELSENIDFQ